MLVFRNCIFLSKRGYFHAKLRWFVVGRDSSQTVACKSFSSGKLSYQLCNSFLAIYSSL